MSRTVDSPATPKELKLDVKLVEISTLVEDPVNARKHDTKNLEAIKGSLARFGQQKPIVVSPKGVVIAGNGTLKAAREMGWSHILVAKSDLQGSEAVAFAIADNRSAELASWDEDVLGTTLQGLREDGLDLAEIGFDVDDLEDFGIKADTGITEENQDDVPEVKESFVKRGDIWTLGNHRLMCGDSTSAEDVARLMAGEKADMVFTDPPYGVSYEKKTKEIAKQRKVALPISGDDLSVDDLEKIISAAFRNIESVLEKRSSYYVCSPQGGELGLMMMMMQDAGLLCRHMVVWVKNASVFSMGRLDYDYQHEPILYGWSKNRTHYFPGKGEFTKSVWHVNREPNKLHPTMKPIALIENAILNSTDINMRVIDLFCGSGSTLIACEKTNRRGFGMEIDEHYCSVIVKRWQDLTGKEAKKVG